MPKKTADNQSLLMHSGRADNWREVTSLADAWAAQRGGREALEAALAAIEAVEEYHAYPGARLRQALAERIASNDPSGAARLARRISNGLLTDAYRSRPEEWDVNDHLSPNEVVDIMPPATGETRAHREAIGMG